MWSTTPLNDTTESKYGFGWFVRPVPAHYTVAHGGGLPGFTSFIWKFLDDKLTVIVMSNQERANLGGLALNIAGLYVPALLQPDIKREL